jgi:integrase
MNGCRGLSDSEIQSVAEILSPRDRVMFLLGIKTGFRITEILSIKIGDVFRHGGVVPELAIKASKTGEYRRVPLHPSVREEIAKYLPFRLSKGGCFLFLGEGLNPLSRSQAWNVLKRAFDLLKLHGKVATHSLRKTYCKRVYKLLHHDLVKTQKAMGHKSILSTIAYLPIDQEEIDAAILAD